MSIPAPAAPLPISGVVITRNEGDRIGRCLDSMRGLCAELIANDKPLAVRYDGQWYFPVLKRYPETAVGGEFPLQANYKSP